MEIDNKKEVCIMCGSKNIYIEKKTGTVATTGYAKYVCSNCGNILSSIWEEDYNKDKKEITKDEYDTVKKPKHYNIHPSGVECIEIVEHMNYCLGNAIKYIWRHKNKNGIEDLEKAKWYIDREIKKLKEKKV